MKPISLLLSFYIVCASALMSLVNWYCFLGNETAHTGLPFWPIYFFMTIGAAISLIAYKENIGKIGLMLSILFLLNTLIINQCSIMLSYENWIKAGMPDKFSTCRL